MLKFKQQLIALSILSSVIATSSQAATPGTSNCGFDKYRSCIIQSCQRLQGGPAGETPMCKPPPYRPQTCDSVRLWLPTTVVYPVVESLYGGGPEAGPGAIHSASGNYISITLNPAWVAMYGYGVNIVAPYIELGAPASAKRTSGMSGWSRDSKKGLVHILQNQVNMPTSQVAIAKSKTDERIFMISWTLFMRAMDEVAGDSKLAMKVSWSPYSTNCYPLIDQSAMIMAQYNSTAAYGSVGKYLNTFSSSPLDALKQDMNSASLGIPETKNKLFDDKCSDSMKTYKGRPIFFVYKLYWMSITTSQIQNCS